MFITENITLSFLNFRIKYIQIINISFVVTIFTTQMNESQIIHRIYFLQPHTYTGKLGFTY